MNRLVLLGLALVLLVGLVVAGWNWQQQRVIQQAYEAGMAAADAEHYEEALALALPYADRHDPQIDYLLSRAYINGPNSIKDIDRGITQRRAAAEAGHMQAAYYLGRWLINHSRDGDETAEGLKWLNQAAECGMPAAHFELGLLFFNGGIVPKDLNRALTLFEFAAWAGAVEAQRNAAVVGATIWGNNARHPSNDGGGLHVFEWLLISENTGNDHSKQTMQNIREALSLSHNVDEKEFLAFAEKEAARWLALIQPTDLLACDFTPPRLVE